MPIRQIILRKVDRPAKHGFENELGSFCEAFGIIGESEKNISKDILEEILRKESRNGQGIKSIVISRKMKVTRGGAIYNLNKLMESGLIVRNGRDYELRGQNLADTVGEMEEDMLRMFKQMRRMAQEIDRELGMDE
jgi:predicted transcriptional regulator